MQKNWPARFALVASSLLAAAAQAQSPGARIDLLPDEIGRTRPTPFGDPPNRIDVTAPAAAVRVAPGPAGRVVVIQRVQIEGVQGFTAGELAGEFAEIIGKPADLPAIAAAVNRVAKRYEAAGYVYYNVLLPNQDFAGGVLRLVVIEGHIASITVNGTHSETLRARIRAIAAQLQKRRPIRRRDLERYLLLIGDIPGITVKYDLKPVGDAPGALALTIDANLKRFDPIASIDNFQSVPGTGINAKLGAVANSLFGLGESTEFRYLFATPWDRLHLFDVRQSHLVNDEGGRLDLIFQYVRQRPELILDRTRIDFSGESVFGRAQYRHPIVRSLKHNLSVFVAFDILRSTYDVAGTRAPGDAIQPLRVGAVYTSGIDDWKGQWQATGQVSTGLYLFNAEVTSRYAGKPNFVKFSGTLARSQEITPEVAIVAKIAGQYALTSVPISETFAFGGREFGRGFNSYELVGDHGGAASVELRYRPSYIKLDRERFDFYLYGFGDYGLVRSIKAQNRITLEEAASVGGGVRFKFVGRATAEIEGAKPVLGRVAALNTNDQRWRVFFRVGVNY